MCEAISNASIITTLIVDKVVIFTFGVLLFISFMNGNGPDQPA